MREGEREWVCDREGERECVCVRERERKKERTHHCREQDT